MIDIKIDEKDHKIYTLIDGQECVVNFRIKKPDIIEFYRTFVPEKLRNKNIAAQLVEFALEHALRQNKKILPTCSYVHSYIKEHPKYLKAIQKP